MTHAPGIPGTPGTPGSPRMRARDAAAEIAAALQRGGFIAYFAGGCVRDRLLGLEPKDYDIATDATPEQITEVFPKARGVGASFGVMLVHRGGHTIEVATFRRDGVYEDGRRPTRVHFGSAEQDARRRDFTINGLFEEPAGGRVIDFVDGVADLQARRLRAIGSAEERLAEDRLRMLRAVRFAARFDLKVDPGIDAAIRRHGRELLGVSRERIGGEMRRILSHPTRARGVHLVEDLGLAAAVLNEAPLPLHNDRLRRLPPDASFECSLAAWMLDRDDDSAGTGRDRQARWSRALVLSNAETEALEGTLETADLLRREWNAMDKAKRKRAAAHASFREALDLRRAEDPAHAEEIAAAVERLASEGLAPAPLVTGDDLVAMGLAPGPHFRTLLESLYDRQLRGEFPGRDAALAAARAMVGL